MNNSHSIPESAGTHLKVRLSVSVYMFCNLLAILLWLLMDDFPWTQSLRTISLLIFFVGISSMFMLSRVFPEKTWTAPFLFLLILFLFHAGLYIYPAVTGEPAPSRVVADVIADTGWFTEELAVRAGYILVLAILAYNLGCLLVAWRQRPYTTQLNYSSSDDSFRKSIATVGGITLTASVFHWLGASIQMAGPLFFLGGYRSFLEQTEGLSNAYIGITFGTAMVAQYVKGIAARTGLLAFTVFVLMGLAIGLRGNVLIPLVAGIIVYARHNSMPGFRFFALGFAAMLTVIAGVKQLRQQGVAGIIQADDGLLHTGPLGAIAEMGASVRVLFMSLRWHEVNNEPFVGGLTYLTPVRRFFEGLLGGSSVPSSQDEGLMNVVVADRVGQIGGSIIGESHHNFGVIGVIVVLFITGYVLASAQISKPTALSTAILGVFAVLALKHVRNSFTPLFAWLLLGLFLIGVAYLMHKIAESKRDPSFNAPSPNQSLRSQYEETEG